MSSEQRDTSSLVIAIEGGIGAGKSRLARYIRANTETIVIDEAESPLMQMYHEDRVKYAFALQMDLLAQRVTALRSAHRIASHGRSVVLDRSILGDVAFARANWCVGWLSAEEFRIYSEIYDELMMQIEPPHATLYLSVDPEEANRRAEERDGEAPPLTYQRELARAHDHVLSDARSRGVRVTREPWGWYSPARYPTEADFLVTRFMKRIKGDLLR